jgi:preprotein translocase subunit SecF
MSEPRERTVSTLPADDAVPADDALAAMGRQRRGPLGRLYHGETAIDFYGRRWWGLILSGVLILVTISSLFINGLNLGIDFEGGVAWEVPATNLTVDQARTILDDHGISGSEAKIQERTNASGKSLLVQVGDQPLAKQTEITEKAIRALVVFLVLVALFIAWRLEWKMASAAIIAMIHDVLISVGVYSVLGFEVTPATVVAFLTILGFSLYDTIVVFEKVKENTTRFTGTRAPYADIVNVSMNQVLMRSLNTTLAALLPVLSLLIIGAGVMGATTLAEFSLALLVGLFTGAYSSIFIATPVLAIMKERDSRYASSYGQHATGAELERLVHGGLPTARQRTRRRDLQVPEGTINVPPPVTQARPETLLTHAPRPRKKRRSS